jgi:hypothetical protein
VRHKVVEAKVKGREGKKKTRKQNERTEKRKPILHKIHIYPPIPEAYPS